VAIDTGGYRRLPVRIGFSEATKQELNRTTRELEAVKKERDDLKVLIDRLPEER
jgi:hypothetical protein